MGTNAALGGRRDPNNRWDFFDVTGDRVVDMADISLVKQRYFLSVGQAGYDPALDRRLVGPDPWDLGPGDGVINILDLNLVTAQYGHSCAAAP